MSRNLARIIAIVGLLSVFAFALWFGWSLWDDRPLHRARRAYEQGAWQEASTAAREILKGDPDQEDALILVARSEARLGRAPFARSIYQRLEPRMLRAEDFFLVGRGLIGDGQIDGGRFGLNRALELEPGHAESLLELVRLDRRLDRLVEAGDEASKLATRPGWEARGLVLLGLVRLAQKDPASAASAFRSALARDPRLVGVEEGSPDDIRERLSESLLMTGLPAEARSHLETLLAGRPDDAGANWLLSRAALQLHDPAAADAALARAGDVKAGHPEAFEPAPYVGFARCEECHTEIFRNQRASHHAQTFRVRGDLGEVPLPAQPVPDPADPAVTHAITRDGPDLSFRTRTPSGEFQAVVEYIMGSGDRAMTLVGRDSHRSWHELRLTYYDSVGHWDRTPAHPQRPDSAPRFLGEPQSEDAIRRCLGCHTNPNPAETDGRSIVTSQGIACERCHGPAGNHLDAVELRFPDPAIARPRLASASRVNALCGQCHGAEGRGIAPDDPELARFQASSLVLSRCATNGGEVTMSCLACHDPHQDAETSTSFYDAKCLACHTPQTNPTPKPPRDGLPGLEAPGGEPRKVACPVNPAGDCTSCHMPKVRTSVPHTTFTDHYIRVRPVDPK